jgi:CTP:phosphocholine cytidylyltransferase-like protein
MDADLSHEPLKIKKFITLLKKNTFIIGSRYISGGRSDLNGWRFLISSLGNYFIKPTSDIIDIEVFINKAIFYLWNDVFKDETEENNIFLNKTTYEDFFPIELDGIVKLKEILEILKIEITAE